MIGRRGYRGWITTGLIVATAVTGAVFVLPGKAAADFNLTTSPLPLNLNVKPGGTVSSPLKIQNSGTTPVRLKVQLMKFSALGTSDKPRIVEFASTDRQDEWVTFSETSFDAPPNVWRTIDMTIRPPASAAFGYYYAVVFSQEGAPARNTDTRSNSINGAVATLVLLNVNAPGEKRELDVANFSADKKFYEYLPATFTVNVKNPGNVHTIPSGNIFISKDGKENLAILSLNQAQGNVLPNSERAFTTSWEDGFPAFKLRRENGVVMSDQNGKPIRDLKWQFSQMEKFRFGKYNAHLTMVYNDGKRDVPVEGDISFWVIPWKLILIVVISLVLIVTGVLVYVRSGLRQMARFKNNKKKE